MHRASPGMANDNDVGTHRVERYCGINQGLALFDTRRRNWHVHDIGAEPLAGEFEGRLRPGRSLKKEVDQGAAAQGRAFLFDLARDFNRFFREIEQKHYVFSRKPLDPEEMPVREE